MTDDNSDPESTLTSPFNPLTFPTQAKGSKPLITPEIWPAIPNFELEALVGRGTFGDVFRARRKSDNAIFAIKVLRPQREMTDAIRTRFLREATVLCQISHPRIVRFCELGIHQDRLYLVMDYIQSTTWKEISARLSMRKRLQIALGIVDYCLDALVYLHGQKLVHRDLKPNNILLANRDNKLRVYLADFGLAKDYLRAGNSGVTSDWEIAGTFGYLAPELLAGVKYFRPESDQYALAATCYDMISGRAPVTFRHGENVLAAIRRHAVPRIETLVPDIPQSVADWLHIGLSADPSRRFPSTQAMRDALKGVLALPRD